MQARTKRSVGGAAVPSSNVPSFKDTRRVARQDATVKTVKTVKIKSRSAKHTAKHMAPAAGEEVHDDDIKTVKIKSRSAKHTAPAAGEEVHVRVPSAAKGAHKTVKESQSKPKTKAKTHTHTADSKPVRTKTKRRRATRTGTGTGTGMEPVGAEAHSKDSKDSKEKQLRNHPGHSSADKVTDTAKPPHNKKARSKSTGAAKPPPKQNTGSKRTDQ